jgi:anti-anti-sigma factor
VSDIGQPPVRLRDGSPNVPGSGVPLFHVRPLAHARGLSLVGELDLSTVGILREALDSLGERAEILDLAELSFMDASGLHALEEYASAPGGAGPLVLVNAPAQTRRLLEITGAAVDPDIELRNEAADG